MKNPYYNPKFLITGNKEILIDIQLFLLRRGFLSPYKTRQLVPIENGILIVDMERGYFWPGHTYPPDNVGVAMIHGNLAKTAIKKSLIKEIPDNNILYKLDHKRIEALAVGIHESYYPINHTHSLPDRIEIDITVHVGNFVYTKQIVESMETLKEDPTLHKKFIFEILSKDSLLTSHKNLYDNIVRFRS